MSIQNQIVAAIEAHLTLDILYKGEWRTVEPHLLGINRKGNLCLSAYQISGGSGSSWRAYLIGNIQQVAISDDIFTVREGYNPADATMLSILTAI